VYKNFKFTNAKLPTCGYTQISSSNSQERITLVGSYYRNSHKCGKEWMEKTGSSNKQLLVLTGSWYFVNDFSIFTKIKRESVSIRV